MSEEIIRMRKFILTCFLLSCFQSTTSLGADAPKIPEEVEIYSRELSTFSNSTAAGLGVERLLKLGRDAAHVLIVPPNAGDADVLERLSEDDFHAVILKMKGFSINRQETVFVDPIPSFFIALSKRAGDQASAEFFEILGKTEHSYIRLQTDYSGCYLFGSLGLVHSYQLWDGYSKKYPTRYPNEVMNLKRDVEEDLTEGTCACEGKETALREFNAFIQTFPNAKISARIRERINQIEQGKAGIREYCISG
jgi:hypothetical protein